MITIKKIQDIHQANQMLRDLGCDPPGISIMGKKMVLSVFHIADLDIRAANILKQDAIAFGADVALSKEASLLKARRADAILIVNQRQLEQLVGKLKSQPFGLKEVAHRLQRDFSNYTKARGAPKIMGIVNITPDSFSDGGKFFRHDDAVKQVTNLITDGADIIDIGGESTGPGSQFVTKQEELRRVLPILLNWSTKQHPTVNSPSGPTALEGRRQLSIDTYKAAVAEQAISRGASIVNDVTALRGDTRMAEVIAKYHDVKIVLMYSKDNTPRTTRRKKQYRDVIKTIKQFLEERIDYALRQAVKLEQIIIDPGMGAFVSMEPRYSFELLSRLSEFKALGCPILIGTSRKSFLGGSVHEREEATLATTLLAAQNGASIVRVHNVKPVKQLFKNLFSC